jgi:hypothetical protein
MFLLRIGWVSLGCWIGFFRIFGLVFFGFLDWFLFGLDRLFQSVWIYQKYLLLP